LIFEKNCGRGGLYEYPLNNSQNGKVLAHLGFNLNVLPGPLTDVVPVWVSARQATVGCQISTLVFELFVVERGGPL
jgi:hypothetical protein